jgi:hypothetical protein
MNGSSPGVRGRGATCGGLYSDRTVLLTFHLIAYLLVRSSAEEIYKYRRWGGWSTLWSLVKGRETLAMFSRRGDELAE